MTEPTPDLHGDPEILRAWHLRNLRAWRIYGGAVAGIAVIGYAVTLDIRWAVLAIAALAICLMYEAIVVAVKNLPADRLRAYVARVHFRQFRHRR